MIKYLIIDDEPLAHDLIEEFCGMLPHLKIVGHCYSAMEAIQLLNSGVHVDIIFLDINMPKLSGFDFLRTLSSPPKVIVTTAYKEYALEGYELNVVDYLLKPFSFDRLVQAINKATKDIPSQKSPVISEEIRNSDSRMFIKSDKKYHQVNVKDILFVEAYGNYVKIHLDNDMIISHEKISYYESELAPFEFLRVHKSYLIAVPMIEKIDGNQIFIGEFKIPIGQTYKSQINKLIS
ncbi:LytR/AlgR family response regulator transcription factor [Marinigracilibium pacificum]|uniref:Response regulator transcription factor n=1 Tax=Marinigracilibium pacificum TaxID=2729599 RepID=A0A848J2H1_9BACT|nr:response regulator transcription factor [Marinigracilibium pacificum]